MIIITTQYNNEDLILAAAYYQLVIILNEQFVEVLNSFGVTIYNWGWFQRETYSMGISINFTKVESC